MTNREISEEIKIAIIRDGVLYDTLNDLIDLCIGESDSNADFDREYWFNISGS